MGLQEWKDPSGAKAGCAFARGECEQANGSWCCGPFIVLHVLGCVLPWVLCCACCPVRSNVGSPVALDGHPR